MIRCSARSLRTDPSPLEHWQIGALAAVFDNGITTHAVLQGGTCPTARCGNHHLEADARRCWHTSQRAIVENNAMGRGQTASEDGGPIGHTNRVCDPSIFKTQPDAAKESKFGVRTVGLPINPR